MRKLKLQIQISLDGFIARPDGDLDWMVWGWDDELKADVTELTDPVETILLGRKMSDGFIGHWTKVVDEGDVTDGDNVEFQAAEKFVDAPKIIFSRTLTETQWANTTIEHDLVDAVNRLKQQEQGGDIIVYGGADFVSNLIKENLIDEYHVFVNPTAIGEGMRIFHGDAKFTLVRSKSYDCGIVVNQYERYE